MTHDAPVRYHLVQTFCHTTDLSATRARFACLKKASSFQTPSLSSFCSDFGALRCSFLRFLRGLSESTNQRDQNPLYLLVKYISINRTFTNDNFDTHEIYCFFHVWGLGGRCTNGRIVQMWDNPILPHFY